MKQIEELHSEGTPIGFYWTEINWTGGTYFIYNAVFGK